MRISLIYMAAGNSRRFAKDGAWENKLLYPLNNKALYRHLLERLIRVVSEDEMLNLIVVSQYPELLGELSSLDGAIKLGDRLKKIYSEKSKEGAAWTIRAALTDNSDDAYAFFVADQPYLQEETVRGFLAKMKDTGAPLGSVRCGKEEGNPTWFSKAYKEELLALCGDKGGRAILKVHPQNIMYYEVEESWQLEDLDVRPEVEDEHH